MACMIWQCLIRAHSSGWEETGQMTVIDTVSPSLCPANDTQETSTGVKHQQFPGWPCDLTSSAPRANRWHPAPTGSWLPARERNHLLLLIGWVCTWRSLYNQLQEKGSYLVYCWLRLQPIESLMSDSGAEGMQVASIKKLYSAANEPIGCEPCFIWINQFNFNELKVFLGLFGSI